jgi:pilus assembly protein Flp/PilA
MKTLLTRFIREDEGQDIIEYALLAGFISITAYVVLSTIGTNVNSVYSTVNTATSSAAS